MTTAYPLSWPPTIPRARNRQKGTFKTSLSAAIKNVETSLRLFGSDSRKALTNLVISSNVTLGSGRPSDTGVAVWFTWDGLEVCIPVDRYETIEANLQAIHHIVEARRVELRHGTLSLVRASLQGFKALPAPPGSQWWEVLGLAPTASTFDIEEAFKRLSSKHHPDRGGSHDMMAKINDARAKALKDRA